MGEKEHQRKLSKAVAKNVQWFVVTDYGKEKYDDETIAEIEEAFTMSKDSIEVPLLDEYGKKKWYKLDLKTMKEIDMDTGKTVDIKREEIGKGMTFTFYIMYSLIIGAKIFKYVRLIIFLIAHES